MRPALLLLASVVALAACGHAPIHVQGVVRESTEMRPLRNVSTDAYKQLHVLVRPAADPGAPGATDCGVAPVEGTDESEQRNNAVCVPPDATNDAVRLVRQRLRAYGLGVVRDASEAHDFEARVLVTGVAPRKPDPTLARAAAKLTFKLDPASPFFADLDAKAAATGFDTVAGQCALRDSDLSSFSASATQPMTPDFDIAALVDDVVDDIVGCDQLARFFVEAHKRFPKP